MRSFFLILAFFFATIINAQKKITTDELIFGSSNIFNKNSPNINDELSKMGNLSIIDKWEFRTETDEWDFGRQEYLLRTSFNDFNSKNIYNQINDVNAESFELLDKQFYENQIFQKYKNIVDLFYLQQESFLLDSILSVLNDQKTLADLEVSNGALSNVNELVKIDFDIRKLNIERNGLIYKKSLILEKLALTFDPVEFQIDTSNWVSNRTILALLEGGPNFSNSEIDLKTQKLKYSEIEMNRQDSEAKRILDFVQLKYAGRNDLTPIKDFSFGVGINIPTKSSNIRKRSEALVDKLEDELELKQIKAEVAQEISDLIFKIKMKNIEYVSYNKYLNEMKNSKALEAFQKMNDPRSILEYKINSLKLQKDLLDIENDLLEEYLELLFMQGRYLDFPNVNFLSNNFNIE